MKQQLLTLLRQQLADAESDDPTLQERARRALVFTATTALPPTLQAMIHAQILLVEAFDDTQTGDADPADSPAPGADPGAGV